MGINRYYIVFATTSLSIFNKIIDMLKSMSGFNFGSLSGENEDIDEYAMYGDG